MIEPLLTRVYKALLCLYPRSYRAEFGKEMEEVFSQALADSQDRSAAALGTIWLKELIGLPAAVAQAHLASASKVPTKKAALIIRQPSDRSWQELILVLIVFLLPAVLILVNQPLLAARSIGALAVAIFLAVMVVIGWLGGIPLWSRPYVGIIIVIAIYLYLFQWVAGMVTPALVSSFTPGKWDDNTFLLLKVASTGMLWLMLFCLTLLAAAILAIFNRFHPLLRPFRQDWIQLSYILYGESIFALILLYQSHHFQPNYAFAGLLCLLAGIWFYLRNPFENQRLLILITCLTLTVGIAGLEMWQSSPDGDWPSFSFLFSTSVGRLLLSWLAMITALLAPGLIARLSAYRAGSAPSLPST